MIVRLRTFPQVSNPRNDRTGPKNDLCIVPYYRACTCTAHSRRLSVTNNSAKNASSSMRIAVAIYVLEER
jgi:hypothetical protein